MIAGFVLLTAGVGVNLLTDSVFIARRKVYRPDRRSYWRDHADRLHHCWPEPVLRPYNSNAVALLSRRSRARANVNGAALAPSLKQPLATIRPLLASPGRTPGEPLLPGTHLSGADNSAGSTRSQRRAYYYIAFQLAALVHAAGHSVGFSILAEGSQADANSRLFGAEASA